MAFCGGLWIPFDFLPKAIQQVAPLLPSYHLGADRAGDSERAGTGLDWRARGGAGGLRADLPRNGVGGAIARTREDVWLEGAYETAAERSGLDGLRLAGLPALLPAGRAGRRICPPPRRRPRWRWCSTSGPTGFAAPRVLWIVAAWFVLGVMFVRDQSGGLGLLCVCGLPLWEDLGAAGGVPLSCRASGAGVPAVLGGGLRCLRLDLVGGLQRADGIGRRCSMRSASG